MARAANPAAARAAATQILRRLREAGHTAYFAGGCVRDALLGLRPTDYDVATDATPARISQLFNRTAEVGAAFGVVLVHEQVGGERVTVEVATFRADGPYSDARRPDHVVFSSPQEDAARRDFTINALFLDPLAEPDDLATPAERAAEGRIIDHVNGAADLSARLIRAVGDPDKRLAEDHLRALRAVRFAARLGFAIDPATAGALTRHAAELRGVSRERIGDELRRILLHPSRAHAVELLQQLGLDAPVLTEAARRVEPAVLRQIEHMQPSVGVPLGAWALDRTGAAGSGLGDEDIGALSRRWRAALCLSNEESAELAAILRGHQYLTRAWSAATVARQKRWASSSWFAGSSQLVRATDSQALISITQTISKHKSDGIGLNPAPLLDGNDLIGAGFSPSPSFKRVLDDVYDAQLEGRVRDQNEAVELARRLYV
ncbi:MAG: CCA tRNA nucleotidyltransferase [Phycisphaerales bacterium]|nr:CCA tRNA nucleotidyltransferase [Phycisphaerales bacterium]